jgi:Tol biopolymer transport system component
VNIASGHAELLHQTAAKDDRFVSTRPDLSADGNTIFYFEAPGQPVRFDIDSRRETKLTPVGTGSWGRRPLSLAVSPDGAQIAYIAGHSLAVAPAAGGESRELIHFTDGSSPRELMDGLGLAWSPDQRYLFFVKPEIRAIWRVPVSGGEAENIGISMHRIRALRIHPDGRRLAFDSVIDAPSEVWALENFLPKTVAAR